MKCCRNLAIFLRKYKKISKCAESVPNLADHFQRYSKYLSLQKLIQLQLTRKYSFSRVNNSFASSCSTQAEKVFGAFFCRFDAEIRAARREVRLHRFERLRDRLGEARRGRRRRVGAHHAARPGAARCRAGPRGRTASPRAAERRRRGERRHRGHVGLPDGLCGRR